MLGKYKYTDSEIKQLLSSITIVVDSREQVNGHVLSWFDKKKIPYIIKKLDTGDYSFFLPKNETFSMHRDIHFDIVIERKGSLDELAGNFASDRDRIENEFTRHKGKMLLVIEDAEYKDIFAENYKSKYAAQSFLGTLHSFSDRYNIGFIFLDKEHTAQFIYFTFYYHLRNLLKG
jgi:ERCC4-type nuclease